MIEVRNTDNGHTAAGWRRPLGVACMCGRRVLVQLKAIGAHSGDMRYLYDRKFTCTVCGRHTVQLWFMTKDEDEAEFLRSSTGPDRQTTHESTDQGQASAG